MESIHYLKILPVPVPCLCLYTITDPTTEVPTTPTQNKPPQVTSTVLAMQLSLIALGLAAAVPMVSAYPVKADTLNCRSGPGTSYKIVKTYKKNTDLKITCQIPGTSVEGTNLWDKTSDGCYVADYYVKTGTSGYVAAHCDASGGGSSSGNLPGLNAVQSSHARAIIGEAKKEGLGRHGCEAGIATAIVEV